MTERSHHQHQRRPPDVEEALSSMLWTPYERPSTDSSSEDDDEKLNKRLRKSRNGYEDDDDKENDVGIVASTTTAAAATAFVPMTSSYFGCNDFLLPTTHFVPFSNIMFNNNNNCTATANVAVVADINHTYQPYHHQLHHHQQHHYQQHHQQQLQQHRHHHQQQQHSLSTLIAPDCHKSNAVATKNNYYPFSYPQYGPPPSLNAKSWWSSTSAAALEPPSYESLYSKNSSVMRLEGSSKGMKPVLQSLKVTTVTTMRTSNDKNTENQSTNRIESDAAAAEDAGGRLVHSFTDNFIDESCKELPESADISHSNNNSANNSHSPQRSNMNHDHLKFINNVAKLSGEQVVESNNNDVTRQAEMDEDEDKHTQRKRKRLANAKYKQSEEKHISEKRGYRDHYDDDDDYDHECLQKVDNKNQKQQPPTPLFIDDDNVIGTTANVHQVNQPASVAERQTTATTTQEMNSPTSISNKSTTTTTTSRNHNQSPAVALAVEQRPATTITLSSSREFVECASSSSLSSPLLRKFTLRPSSARRKVVNPVAVGAVKSGEQPEQQQPLTPNKCLAELERLRAEIHASESQSKHQTMLVDNKMRLNVPPATVAVASPPTIAATTATATTNALKFVPTTSSVFLTTNNLFTNNNNNNNNSCSNNVSNNNNNNTTNYRSRGNVNSNNYNNNNNNCSVAILTTATTTTTKSCQRQPSLTIQVNNSNNNNNNNNRNNNNNGDVVSSPTVLNESVVNNNGVSVVNCNYVQTENSSNRNSSVAVSVNSSSSVPKVFTSSSSNSSNDSSSSRPANAARRSKNIANNEISVAPIATSTTATATNRESVNVISVNSQTDYPQRPSVATTPSSPTSTSSNSTPTASPTRTFTSTECQTDDIESVHLRTPVHRFSFQPPPFAAASSAAVTAPASREQRRRERRERRHQQHQLQQLQQLQHVVAQLPPPHHHPHAATRRHSERHSLPAPPLPPPHAHPHLHPPLMHHASVPPSATMLSGMSPALLRPMLPDILHSHFPPPYSALSGAGDSISTVNVPSPPQRPPPPPPPATMLTPVISTVPLQGATTIVSDGRFSIPLPIIRRSPSERSGKGCCGQWFAGPPLRALIAVVALGGVACALGGAALGATGLAGPPSSHFTAALLMIGVGVVLVTVSGAAWRMTAPGGPPCLGLGSSVDLGRCGRRPCSRGGGAPHGLLYPEFQHRPPPPSYQASMQEYRLRLLLLDRDRQNGVVRGNSPPPTYRSHSGSLLRASLTTTMRGGGGGSGSVGGSEYSLPPSYRSRNATPATICSDRSIETAPSGHLLANEDIPEPLSAELLPQYSSLQRLQLHLTDLSTQSASPNQPKSNPAASATATTISGHSTAGHQLRTSAIVEVEAAPNDSDQSVASDKISLVRHKAMRSSGSASAKGKELVTIVTISQNHSDVTSPNEVETSAEQQHQQQQQSHDQMQILAHL